MILVFFFTLEAGGLPVLTSSSHQNGVIWELLWGKLKLHYKNHLHFLMEFIVSNISYHLWFTFAHRSVCRDASRHHSSYWWWSHWMSHGMAFSFLWIPGISFSYEGILPWWGQVDHCSQTSDERWTLWPGKNFYLNSRMQGRSQNFQKEGAARGAQA